MKEDFFLTPVPLTKKETALRKKLEEKIFTTVQGFYVEIGQTLSEIQEKRLYKSTHRSFAEYSREVLDMAKQSAYQYIQAYGVVKNLSTMVDENELESVRHGGQKTLPFPQNERQARALVGLAPEEQREVWQETIATAENGKVTAAHVRKTVRELGYAKMKKQVDKAKRPKKANGARKSEAFALAFKGFLDAVQTEIDGKWATTDRLTVVRHLDGIRGAISENGNHRIPEKGYAIEASNTEKLMDAGFTIYQMDEKKLVIRMLLHDDQWSVVEQFEDKKVMVEYFENILKDVKNLRG
jgi:hypothetical protein